MRVDHYNSFVAGGAAIAARRVHHGLLDIGVDSHFHFADAGSTELESVANRESYHRLAPAKRNAVTHQWSRFRQRRRLRAALKNRPAGLEIFSPARNPASKRLWPQVDPSRIAHLHWIGGGRFDWRDLFAHLADRPLVWTLHDMNALTGGCHYTNGCDRYSTTCQHCPQLAAPAANDLASETFAIKLRQQRQGRMHFVAPSRWLWREAQRSPLTAAAARFHYIPYGVDASLFRPGIRAAARHELGLPQDAKIVAFGADEITNPRKGFPQLLNSLRRLGSATSGVIGLCFGRGEVPQSRGAPPIRNAGFLGDPTEMARLFTACDVFAMSSIEDNLPQTGLEALACGRPVVAFAAGGVKDYVIPHQTGLLAAIGDEQELAAQIGWLLERPAAQALWGRQGRALVREQFSPLLQASRYMEVYQELGEQPVARAA
ncbi:MAG: glycosyltransferase [Pirellulaceae bacterium]|nr:glycosyltransferase [Pirellulaceae bacterium]